MSVQRANYKSLLLNDEENNRLISAIGPASTTSAIGTTQIFTTEAPNHDTWIYRGSGAVLLVRDSNRKSYFIRFLSLDGESVDMEQELYKTIVLHKTSNQFLAFEAHGCIWGLLFCEKSELNLLETEILSKIRQKGSSKVDKKSSVQLKSAPKKSNKPNKNTSEVSNSDKKQKKKKEKTTKKGKVDKKPRLEISAPSNFTVVAHVGHDGVTGIENMENSSKWEALVKFIYGTTTDLSQEETSHLVDLVTKNGGIEKYTEAIEKTKKKKGDHATLTKSAVAKPPPTPTKVNAPPTPIKSTVCAAPPPPPPPSAPPIPQHETNQNLATPRPALGASLQDQIHKGAMLKKVEINEESSDEEAEGLLGALVNNLSAFRSKVKASSSEDSSDESNDDSDDW